jgi:hypothetical protein
VSEHLCQGYLGDNFNKGNSTFCKLLGGLIFVLRNSLSENFTEHKFCLLCVDVFSSIFMFPL